MVAIAVFDPAKQLNRAKDAQRLSDLEQIRNALDMYYNDHNAYPTPPLPTGTWNGNGTTVYMEKMPVDPDTKLSYPYETDSSSSNPQWAVVYATLSTLTPSCPLTNMMSGCLPSGFVAGKTACVVLGNVDCNYISSHSMP